MSASAKLLIVAAVSAMVPVGLLWMNSPSAAAEAAALPFAEVPYVLGDGIDAYVKSMMSGDPPPDGIPSIDRPRFVSAEDADLHPRDMVIGFDHGGEARAYPQLILVHHEIVNDRVGSGACTSFWRISRASGSRPPQISSPSTTVVWIPDTSTPRMGVRRG